MAVVVKNWAICVPPLVLFAVLEYQVTTTSMGESGLDPQVSVLIVNTKSGAIVF